MALTSFAEKQRHGNSRADHRQRPRVDLVPIGEMTETGVIKWYDVDRRYGFIIPDAGGSDVFFHRSDIRKYGIREDMLVKDVPVKFISKQRPGVRPEVVAIALA